MDNTQQIDKSQEMRKNPKTSKILKKFGVGAFLFFLAKGLVWIAIFFGAKELVFG